ncbi:MAG: glycoside hydrolase family 28 protein [Firmicutes bacterium]|nr:glycoside hydrolase family 28 protein [Bacillota bacterium]
MNTAFTNILNYAAASREGQDWTEAFRQAFAEIAEQGGGILFVPAGQYPTRSVQLYSNTTLWVDAGATLKFTDDIENYELIDTEFEGIATKAYKPLVFADHAENIALIGRGTLDGSGQRWWTELRARKLAYTRPNLVCFQYCRNIKIEDVTLTMSPSWTIHPLYCDNMLIRGVTIRNPWDSPNTDGMDPDATSNLRIEGCTVDVGDDCIVLKSGTEDTPEKHPCENITITGCTMLHGHGGVVIGSEMSGGVRNVVISNCVFYETDRGIRVKTRRRRGGVVEDVIISNIVMDKVLCPFVFNMYYNCGKDGRTPFVRDKNAQPVDEGTPILRNVQINNIIARDITSCAGFINGLPEMPVDNVQFNNCSVTMAAEAEAALPAMADEVPMMKQSGFYVRNAKGIIFNNVVLKGIQGGIYDLDGTADVTIH